MGVVRVRVGVRFEAGEFEMSSGSYLSTYLVGRQSDRRYQVTVNNPNGNAERVADFATLEQAKAWVRNQVLATNQPLNRPVGRDRFSTLKR
jgi:hypothetical protein